MGRDCSTNRSITLLCKCANRVENRNEWGCCYLNKEQKRANLRKQKQKLADDFQTNRLNCNSKDSNGFAHTCTQISSVHTTHTQKNNNRLFWFQWVFWFEWVCAHSAQSFFCNGLAIQWLKREINGKIHHAHTLASSNGERNDKLIERERKCIATYIKYNNNRIALAIKKPSRTLATWILMSFVRMLILPWWWWWWWWWLTTHDNKWTHFIAFWRVIPFFCSFFLWILYQTNHALWNFVI